MRSLLALSFATQILIACGESTAENSHLAVEVPTTAATQFHFTAEAPIIALAVLPAVGHRGSARIAVAHGENGAAMYTLDGDVVWRDDTPAKLISFYQGNLIVYRDHQEETVLDRYEAAGVRTPVLVESQSPSPIAATTIQRTSFAALGPVRITDTAIELEGATVETPSRAMAVASADRLIPRTDDLTLVYGTMDGEIHYGLLSAFAD